ncbi:TPA: 4-phosphopantetheinyl transferase, partial [Proteus mirabilis]|nr:4-phosphopantetheinyl transferase [Proteus mirabilis]
MSNSNLFIDNEVHIWIGNLKTMPCLSKAKSRMHILNNDEISSLFDYSFIKQRNLFLLSRVMLRDILSFYLKISPEDVRFSKNEYGKPFILNESKENIYFNLSHSNNCVALAISNTSSVGIDIEYFNRDIEINSIIDYY